MNLTKRKRMTSLCVVILFLLPAKPGYAAWYQEAAGWRYEQQGEDLRESWVEEESGKYYLGASGQMLTGWNHINEKWYFLNPVSDGAQGRVLSGWQWVDGYCYFFQADGVMSTDTITSDGYQVNRAGRWMEQGMPVYHPGNGYVTKGNRTTTAKTGGGGGGGRSSKAGTKPELRPAENIKRGETDDAAPTQQASPSDAERINWEIRFTDAQTHAVSLAASRKGEIVQGGSLTVNFLRHLIKDGVIWEAVEEPPLEITVHGPGNGIYYVEYVNNASAPVEEDQNQEEKRLLDEYLVTAKEWETVITREEIGRIPDSRFYITSQSTNNQRVKTLATQIQDSDEYVFYMVGKNFEPNGIGIPVYFGKEAAYSKLLEASIVIRQDVYSVMRFTIQRTYSRDTCSHHWELIGQQAPTCLGRGGEVWACIKCQDEVECFTNPTGHVDFNEDITCDRCGSQIDSQEVPDKIHWRTGDFQVREIDGEAYLFECIDQNYSDRTENHRQAALFLCTSVIPANTGSGYIYQEQPDGRFDYVFQPGPIVNFGNNNDYKYSNIRKWLEKHRGSFDNTEEINIGVDYAYMGSTAPNRFSQQNDEGLQGHYIGNQKLTAKLFIISVDEALKYKNYLWKFNGSEVDNPETQYSAYSKAYWLRNPLGTDRENSQTRQVYVVDLVHGNIHPQAVKPENETVDEELKVTATVGVRPAFAVAQD